jgi:hypothetical protein
MKVSKLYTYLDADDAFAIISFLGEVQDLLWQAYGDRIIENQTKHKARPLQFPDDQLELDFDDRIPF